MNQIQRILSQASVASSSTGVPDVKPHDDTSLKALLIVGGILSGVLLGVCALICCLRLTCRRVDACQTEAAIQRSREAASGSINSEGRVETKELLQAGETASTPLLNDRRSCWSRLFCAKTLGRGFKEDLYVSLAEGIVGALSLCSR